MIKKISTYKDFLNHLNTAARVSLYSIHDHFNTCIMKWQSKLDKKIIEYKIKKNLINVYEMYYLQTTRK